MGRSSRTERRRSSFILSHLCFMTSPLFDALPKKSYLGGSVCRGIRNGPIDPGAGISGPSLDYVSVLEVNQYLGAPAWQVSERFNFYVSSNHLVISIVRKNLRTAATAFLPWLPPPQL